MRYFECHCDGVVNCSMKDPCIDCDVFIQHHGIKVEPVKKIEPFKLFEKHTVCEYDNADIVAKINEMIEKYENL